MAAPITLATFVNASPETLFDALSRADGLASFWTFDSKAEPVVGSITQLGIPTGSRLEFRVDALESGRRVVWTPLTNLMRGPHWAGTTVTWDLHATENGPTEVRFQQGNWPEDLPQTELGQVTLLWAQVLHSLTGYVETGTPQPIFAEAAFSNMGR